MAMNAYPARTTQPEVQGHLIGLEGAGSSDPSKRYGTGVTVTRTGAGAYKIAWAETPGTFLGWSAHLGAATPADVAGHSLVRATYDGTTRELAFVLYNAWDAAHDLAASEYLDVVVWFKTTAVEG